MKRRNFLGTLPLPLFMNKFPTLNIQQSKTVTENWNKVIEGHSLVYPSEKEETFDFHKLSIKKNDIINSIQNSEIVALAKQLCLTSNSRFAYYNICNSVDWLKDINEHLVIHRAISLFVDGLEKRIKDNLFHNFLATCSQNGIIDTHYPTSKKLKRIKLPNGKEVPEISCFSYLFCSPEQEYKHKNLNYFDKETGKTDKLNIISMDEFGINNEYQNYVSKCVKMNKNLEIALLVNPSKAHSFSIKNVEIYQEHNIRHRHGMYGRLDISHSVSGENARLIYI